MRYAVGLLPILQGCQYPLPDAALVARLEQRLSTDPCLRDLASLRRVYRFAQRGARIDRNLVDVEVQQAGYRGLPAGLFIEAPGRDTILDDGHFFAAHATYAIDRDDLDLWACGDNAGGSIRHEPRY